MLDANISFMRELSRVRIGSYAMSRMAENQGHSGIINLTSQRKRMNPAENDRY